MNRSGERARARRKLARNKRNLTSRLPSKRSRKSRLQRKLRLKRPVSIRNKKAVKIPKNEQYRTLKMVRIIEENIIPNSSFRLLIMKIQMDLLSII